MKKVGRIILFSLAAVLILLLLFTALFRMEKGEKSFEASIVKIEEDCLFIAPLPAEEEMRQASEIKIEQKQLTETELLPLKEGEQMTERLYRETLQNWERFMQFVLPSPDKSAQKRPYRL